MPGYTYPAFVQAIGALIEVTIVDPNSATPFLDADYNTMLPRAIEAAEQRMYRELDLLFTYVTDTTSSLTAPNNRVVTLPTAAGWVIGGTLIGSSVGLGAGTGSPFIVLEQVSIYANGKWQLPMQPVSKDAIESFWPDDAAPQSPSYPTMWSPVDQLSVLVAPPPDATYQVKLFGTQRPLPLSSVNTTTPLSEFLPDAFLYAAMSWWVAAQRDFSPGSDNPAMAIDFEGRYLKAFGSADAEEARKKWQAPGAATMLPSPIAGPQMRQ